MTTLTANLKHYYQCHALWPAYIALLSFGGFPVLSEYDPEVQILFCLVFSFGTGSLASAMIMQVAQKPFVFLLPGHRRAVVQTTAVVGIFVAIFVSLPTLRSSAAATEPFSVLLGSVSAGLVCYWLAVFAGFYGLWGMVGLILVVIIGAGSVMLQFLDAPTTSLAVLMAVISAIVSVAAYSILTRWDLRRRYCMRPDVGTFGGYVSPERARQKVAMQHANFGNFAFDSFFMQRILKAAPYSRARQGWTALYRSLRPMLAFLRRPIWFAVAIIHLVILVSLCGIGQDNGCVMFLAVGALSFLGMPPAIQTCFPSALGRSERFGSLLIVSVVRAGLAMMMGIVCGLFSNMVVPLMPGFFVPADMRMFFLPLFVAPLAMIGVEILASYRNQIMVPLLIAAVDTILVLLVMWGLVSAPQYFGTALAMTAGVWVVYIFVLFCATRRYDLVVRRV